MPATAPNQVNAPYLLRRTDVAASEWVAFGFHLDGRSFIGFITHEALYEATGLLDPSKAFDQHADTILACAARKIAERDTDQQGRVHIDVGEMLRGG